MKSNVDVDADGTGCMWQINTQSNNWYENIVQHFES